VTAAKQYKVTAKMKLEGKDLRKLESGVVRFMRYRWERGRGEERFTYFRDACL
jgi:hypothetical protein